MPFKKILFVSSGLGDEESSLRSAVHFADMYHAELDVLVLVPELPANLSEYQKQLSVNLKRQTEELLAKFRPKSHPLKYEMDASKRPAFTAIRHAIKHEYDLVIKKVEQCDYSGFRAIDMDLLRKCPTALMLLRDNHPLQKAKISVAVDPESDEQAGQDLSIRLLNIASEISTTMHQDLSVISCWNFTLDSTLADSTWFSMEEHQVERERKRDQEIHFSFLNELVEKAKLGVVPNIQHVEGYPRDAIPETVKETHTDLLVMGTVARTGISGFIIGNTAENILQSLDCSVLALKPEGFKSPVAVD